MDQYFLEVFADDGGGSAQILTTPIFKTGCCCVPDKVRVHFLNYLGTFDAINFNPPQIIHATTSSDYQRSLSYPLLKTDSGVERFNVRSNESYECRTGCYGEPQMNWCMELMDSPKAFMEWKGTQGQADSFLPIKVEDVKFEKQKEEDRYNYELVLQFKVANEKIILRN